MSLPPPAPVWLNSSPDWPRNADGTIRTGPSNYHRSRTGSNVSSLIADGGDSVRSAHSQHTPSETGSHISSYTAESARGQNTSSEAGNHFHSLVVEPSDSVRSAGGQSTPTGIGSDSSSWTLEYVDIVCLPVHRLRVTS